MIDLHLHTSHSDGTWSPRELVEHAVSIGLSTMALTDHDTTGGVDEALETARGRIRVIEGVEINTLYRTETGYKDVHILGYGIDRTCPALVGLLSAQIAARRRQMLDSITLINNASGLSLNFDMLESISGQALGKAHLTEAIVREGGASDIMQAYQRYTSRQSPCYVERASCTPFAAIAAIKASGGVASIAHPGGESHVPALLEQLIDAGLDAIEVFHRVHDDELVSRYLQVAAARKLLVTGGSDCHGPYRSPDEYFPPTVGEKTLAEQYFDLLQKRFV